MKMVDANYVLRYLLQDVPEQFETAKQNIEKSRIFLPFEVMAEVIYVFISIMDNDVAQAAIEHFRSKNLDFVDALLIGYAGVHQHEVLTFD